MKWLGDRSLADQISEVQTAIKTNPADGKLRVFFFQLLAITGEWGRALNQLKVIHELDAAAIPMVQTYSHALRIEPLREAIFAGDHQPLLLGEPTPWVASLLYALKLDAQSHFEEANRQRADAFEQAPASVGTLKYQANRMSEAPEAAETEVSFEWVADADERLGPMLEAIIDGKYYWVPFHHIRQIRIEAPADLRDLVWMPAFFQWINGGEKIGLIPTRYPGTQICDDDRLRTAARTEWVECSPGRFHGFGQRLLATDQDEFGLMDIRALSFGNEFEHPEVKDSHCNES